MLLAARAFWPCIKNASLKASTIQHDRTRNLRRWRVPLLAFGVHTATTLVPVLAELYAWPTLDSPATADTTGLIHGRTPISVQSKALLYSFYVPYLLGPLLLVWRMLSFFEETPANSSAIRETSHPHQD
jgi:hypothetical protein